MKYAVAIAPENALPSAFVVFRGFSEHIPLAADLGYKGVELALRRAGDVDEGRLDPLLSDNGLEVSAISTGQVFAELGYALTDPERSRREKLHRVLEGIIDLASVYGRQVNIGRVRGMLGENREEESRKIFRDSIQQVCSYAESKGVDILLEPVNRYELNFINSLREGSELLQSLGIRNLWLMPDVFHMNIEDASIPGELDRCYQWVRYLHFADSNRLAPGWGHTDFRELLNLLERKSYEGWISIEILPEPSPELAAKQAIDYLTSLTKP